MRFLLFKGPGSFKTISKIGGNVDELKAYRLIPLTPPLLFHFTLPLKCEKYLHILAGITMNRKACIADQGWVAGGSREEVYMEGPIELNMGPSLAESNYSSLTIFT
jgi:hypothetical protein